MRKIIVQASTGEKIAYNPGRYILRRLGVLLNKYIIRNYANKKIQIICRQNGLIRKLEEDWGNSSDLWGTDFLDL